MLLLCFHVLHDTGPSSRVVVLCSISSFHTSYKTKDFWNEDVCDEMISTTREEGSHEVNEQINQQNLAS